MTGEQSQLRREERTDLELADFFIVLSKYRVVIAACTLAFAGIAATASLIMTPIYRSEMVLTAVAADTSVNGLSAVTGQLGNLASLAGIDLSGGGSSKEEAIALLRSRAFTMAFISDENLLPVLFQKEWDSTAGRWKLDADVPTLNDAYEAFDKMRNISEDTKTGLIVFSIEFRDRELAAKWAMQLVDRLNTAMRNNAIAEADRNIDYLKAEAVKSNVVEVQKSIYSLIETQVKSSMLAKGREAYALKTIDPAIVPDEDDFVHPRRLLFIAIGLLVGGILGLIAAFFSNALSNSRQRVEFGNVGGTSSGS